MLQRTLWLSIVIDVLKSIVDILPMKDDSENIHYVLRLCRAASVMPQ
jgi:hypothetical protein